MVTINLPHEVYEKYLLVKTKYMIKNKDLTMSNPEFILQVMKILEKVLDEHENKK